MQRLIVPFCSFGIVASIQFPYHEEPQCAAATPRCGTWSGAPSLPGACLDAPVTPIAFPGANTLGDNQLFKFNPLVAGVLRDHPPVEGGVYASLAAPCRSFQEATVLELRNNHFSMTNFGSYCRYTTELQRITWAYDGDDSLYPEVFGLWTFTADARGIWCADNCFVPPAYYQKNPWELPCRSIVAGPQTACPTISFRGTIDTMLTTLALCAIDQTCNRNEDLEAYWLSYDPDNSFVPNTETARQLAEVAITITRTLQLPPTFYGAGPTLKRIGSYGMGNSEDEENAIFVFSHFGRSLTPYAEAFMQQYLQSGEPFFFPHFFSTRRTYFGPGHPVPTTSPRRTTPGTRWHFFHTFNQTSPHYSPCVNGGFPGKDLIAAQIENRDQEVLFPPYSQAFKVVSVTPVGPSGSRGADIQLELYHPPGSMCDRTFTTCKKLDQRTCSKAFPGQPMMFIPDARYWSGQYLVPAEGDSWVFQEVPEDTVIEEAPGPPLPCCVQKPPDLPEPRRQDPTQSWERTREALPAVQ